MQGRLLLEGPALVLTVGQALLRRGDRAAGRVETGVQRLVASGLLGQLPLGGLGLRIEALQRDDPVEV